MALSRLQWKTSDAASGEAGLDVQLNVYNLSAMLARPPAVYSALRFDPNNTCNVQCVYCHNHRSSDIVPTEAFLRIITDKVVALHTFQMGCVMEPTLDARLCDLLLAVGHSPARPTEATILQTNGILLHQHDPVKLRDAGLTHLAVSIDAADAGVQRSLRGGTSLDKVARNVRAFRTACPDAQVNFITTVTRENLPTLPDLVRLGLDLGVSRFVLREVFYHADSTVVDHARMPGLLLRTGEYAAVAAALIAQFGSQTEFDFADRALLERIDQTTRRDSLRD